MSQSFRELTRAGSLRGILWVGSFTALPSPQYRCLLCHRSFDVTDPTLSSLNLDGTMVGKRESWLSRALRVSGTFIRNNVARLVRSPETPTSVAYLLWSIERLLWASPPSSLEGAIVCGGSCPSTKSPRSG